MHNTLKWSFITIGSFIAVIMAIGAIASAFSPQPESVAKTKTVVQTVAEPKRAPKPNATPKRKPNPDAAQLAEVIGLTKRGVQEFDAITRLTRQGQSLAGSGDMTTVCGDIVPSLERHIDTASGIVRDLHGYGDIIRKAGQESTIITLETERDQMQRQLGVVQNICATS